MNPNVQKSSVVHIGDSPRRVEDHKFLTGRGQYVDDLDFPSLAHGVPLLSPHAHARIVSIDVQRALQAPGVLCVLTGQDAIDDGLGGFPPLFMPEDMGGPKGYRTSRPVLVADRVRHVGDRVAFVVAETADQARDALDLIEVDYEPLPAVVDLSDASAEGAPQIWEGAPGNRCCMVMFGNEAATTDAFAAAAHVTTLELLNNRVSANAIEPRCAIGLYSGVDDTYILYSSLQNPHGARQMLAQAVLKVEEIQLRVVSPDVGGGFGMKADPYPEDAMVLWAARRTGRPVKWVPTRSESIATDNHGRDQRVNAEMALDAQGRILAIRMRSMHSFGAYVMSAAVAPLTFAVRFVPSVYNVPAFHGVNVAIFTNTCPTGPYRGAGRPEATYVCERLIDQAAHELGLNPAELRRRNLIRPDQLPYSTHTGFVYDSGDFPGILEKALRLSGEESYSLRKAESAAKGLLRGRGIGFFIEQGSIFNDKMTLRFDASGGLTILSGLHSHGQSHATVFAQLVSDWLGVPFASVKYLQGDTDKISFGRGTYAARSSMIGSNALRIAADELISKGKPIAAFLMNCPKDEVEFKDRLYAGPGGKQIPMTEVAKAAHIKAGPLASFGVGLEASGVWNTDPPNFPNGCHVCELVIDPETGVVDIESYTAVDDVGRVLNPQICEGQVHGGVAQGIGQALLEQVVYDRETGQLISGSFMDYGMPRADDIPMMQTQLEEVTCKTNPVGVKAVGEAGTIGAPAAVMNAVHDALRAVGVTHLDMPATPLKVWNAIQAAKVRGQA